MSDIKKAKAEAKQLVALLDLSNLQEAKNKAERVVVLINKAMTGEVKAKPKLKTSKGVLSERTVLQAIKDNPGIHTTGIRDYLRIEDDAKGWKTWAIAGNLERDGKVQSQKKGIRRCWWVVK